MRYNGLVSGGDPPPPKPWSKLMRISINRLLDTVASFAVVALSLGLTFSFATLTA